MCRLAAALAVCLSCVGVELTSFVQYRCRRPTVLSGDAMMDDQPRKTRDKKKKKRSLFEQQPKLETHIEDHHLRRSSSAGSVVSVAVTMSKTEKHISMVF